jgi:zinc protease
MEILIKNKKVYACFALIVLILFIPLSGWSLNQQNIIRATLTNGLRVVIVKNTLAPVVTIQVNYLVGSNEAPEGFPGMAHAQEHMMFRGSPGLSAEQLADINALTGGRFNADTQQSVTQYISTVANDQLDIVLNMEATRMRGVRDSQELWEQERGAIEQEVARDLSNQEYVLYIRLLAELFAGTPYAHDALGTRDSFQKTTGDMLKDFYNKWYAPNNAVLVIVGDVDLQKTLVKIKKLFEPIARKSIPSWPAIIIQPIVSKSIAFDTDLPYGLSVIAYRLPGYESPDFAAAMILADVLDSRRGNLYAMVPDGKALSAGFEAGALSKAGFGYAMASFPHDGNGNHLIAEMKEVISKYVKEGIPADLVEASKRHEISQAEFQKNSIEGLASAWSQAVAVEGRVSPDDDIKAIKNVTIDDVNRIAREYLIADKAITAVLTPQPSGMPVAAKGFGGGESFSSKQVTQVILPIWAKKAETVPKILPSKERPVVSVLSNGIRLIVQPEDISPTVTVIGRVKNNAHLQEQSGKEGVSSILDKLFSYGTVSLDRLSFQKAQDDIGAEISVGSSFSLKVLSDNFERGMELLADDLLHPLLLEAAFNIVKDETIGSLRGKIKSPDYLAKRALRSGLFPENDPALRDATPETVANILLPDVKDYHAKVFRPDMTTIVIIGMVSPKQARTIAERYLGKWEAVGTKPETDLPEVPPNKASQFHVPDSFSVQDQVMLSETTNITRKHPDYYALEFANHILSDAFYSSWLYRDLREKTGLVYSVESEIEAGKHRSLFSIFYGCDPPNAGKARAIIERDLQAMQTTPITSNELRQTKILLLRQIPLSESSMDNIASEMLSLSQHDLPLDESRHAAKRYQQMNAKEIRDAFNKWIRSKDFVQVIEGPNL